MLLNRDHSFAQKVAMVSLLFEAFMANTIRIEEDSTIAFRFPDTKLRLLEQMHNFDVVRKLAKFFSKRIPCHCLDDLAMTAPRTAGCNGCKEFTVGSSLRVCSACGIVSYCSKECQVKDWPQHKLLCKEVQACAKEIIEASNNNEDEEKVEDNAVPMEEAN